MLGEIQFVMVNGFINERPIPLVGFVGENDARQIKVVTFDDMSTVSVTELVIGDIEAGIFEKEQKAIPVFDRLSGSYVDRTQTTLSIYLNKEMLGDSGLKFLQLVMYNETGEIVKKSNQFIVRVGNSNTPVYYAPETKSVKTLETYVKEITEEAIKLAFGLQEEVTSSNDFVNKKALYIYKGNEEDYQNGYWYYYDDTQKRWMPGGPYKNPTDEVLRLLAQKQDALTFDSTPTEDSQNPVTSDGVFKALSESGHQITMDEFPINGSTNPVTSDGLYRKFGETDAQHQSLSTRVGRIQEEQTELANDIQQNTSAISQNAANISSQGATIAEHQTSISENASAIEGVRGIANSAVTKADAVDARLDGIIAESGTSDAETIAARTNANTGITYTTLGQRLDAENSEIEEELLQKAGLSDEAKQALLACFAKVAWIDEHGQTYYDTLEDALYPPVELARISAVFDSSAVIYNTNTLDDLRQYLTVTAIYSDHTTATVTEYTLSGMLAEGTSIITVNYEGKTTTFIVAVTAVTVSSINATYVQSGLVYPYDDVDKLKNDLTVSALWGDGTTTTLSENDYTLNGTLLPGTATITATHDGKSSSFTVSVETPTWRYSASDGTLLSEQSYINNASINQLCTEEIFDGKLRLTSPQNSAEPAIEYYLTPQTNTHAAVRLKVRYISIPIAIGAVGLRISLSDGSKGSRIGVHALTSDASITKLTARAGTTDIDIAEIALNTWYEILLVKNGLNTAVVLDGVEIYNSDSPSTSYTVENKIWNQSVKKSASEPRDSIVDIDYIEYYNYDVAG